MGAQGHLQRCFQWGPQLIWEKFTIKGLCIQQVLNTEQMDGKGGGGTDAITLYSSS